MPAASSEFTRAFQQELTSFEAYLQSYWDQLPAEKALPIQTLKQSVSYSLFNGGKRFRPLLSLLTAKALKHSPERVYSWAVAVEMIHTYSLIHDDLPVMDNDDERRGQPTNHKVYGEAVALLAGDTLLTEAFGCLAESYQETSSVGLRVCALLSQAAGVRGMVGGQALDIAEVSDRTLDQLVQVHRLKTGALIRTAVEGAAVLCEASPDQLQSLVTYAEKLGLAFQVADDILDYDPKAPEAVSFPALLGIAETKSYLQNLSAEAEQALADFGSSSEGLIHIVKYNLMRQH